MMKKIIFILFAIINLSYSHKFNKYSDEYFDKWFDLRYELIYEDETTTCYKMRDEPIKDMRNQYFHVKFSEYTTWEAKRFDQNKIYSLTWN